MSSATKWNKGSHTPGNNTRQNLIVIGDSLWYSSDHGQDNKGMAEFSIKSKQIIQIIPYPSDIQPKNHCCVLVKSIIYIIDGKNGSIIAFNPNSKSYTKDNPSQKSELIQMQYQYLIQYVYFMAAGMTNMI